MDWGQLERDINDSTSMLLKQRSHNFSSARKNPHGGNRDIDENILNRTHFSTRDESVDVSQAVCHGSGSGSGTGSGGGMENEYLKIVVNKQQLQINQMEKTIQSIANSQKQAKDREMAMETNAVHQALLMRVSSLEDMTRGINDNYASKDALLQLLNAVMEQIRECNRCIDSCAQQSSSVTQFTDAFLQALVEVSNGGSGSGGGVQAPLGSSGEINMGGSGSFSASGGRKRSALSLSLLLGLGP